MAESGLRMVGNVALHLLPGSPVVPDLLTTCANREKATQQANIFECRVSRLRRFPRLPPLASKRATKIAQDSAHPEEDDDLERGGTLIFPRDRKRADWRKKIERGDGPEHGR